MLLRAAYEHVLCVLGGLNGVHMSVLRSAVCAHSSMLLFTCKHGTSWSSSSSELRLKHCRVKQGKLLISKIIGLLRPAISLIIMKASLQFSNYYSMLILFLSNKEGH